MLLTSLTLWAICSGTRSDAGRLTFLRRRTVKLASVSRRYTRLWFTPKNRGRRMLWMRACSPIAGGRVQFHSARVATLPLICSEGSASMACQPADSQDFAREETLPSMVRMVPVV